MPLFYQIINYLKTYFVIFNFSYSNLQLLRSFRRINFHFANLSSTFVSCLNWIFTSAFFLAKANQQSK